MVLITYSQPKLKKDWKCKINKIFNAVKTTATPDLWIKIFIYRDKTHNFNGEQKSFPAKNWRGHYRCAEVFGHGFYDEEWKFLNSHPKIKHCITLKIGESCNEEDIASLIAHEFRHYLQWKKYGTNKLRKCNRAIQVERDSNKWQKRRIKKLIGEGKIKHKAACEGFMLLAFQKAFKDMME